MFTFLGKEKATQSSDLSSAVLEFFLVEFLPILHSEETLSTDWLSKDVTVQLAKVCVGDLLNNVCDEVLQSIDSEDGWMYYLACFRQYLWPDTKNDDEINATFGMNGATREDESSVDINRELSGIRGK